MWLSPLTSTSSSRVRNPEQTQPQDRGLTVHGSRCPQSSGKITHGLCGHALTGSISAVCWREVGNQRSFTSYHGLTVDACLRDPHIKLCHTRDFDHSDEFSENKRKTQVETHPGVNVSRTLQAGGREGDRVFRNSFDSTCLSALQRKIRFRD